jgi:hypothetical protein
MLKDNKSTIFVVPDDHFAGVNEHWQNQIRDLERKGLRPQAAVACGQYSRQRSLGFTYAQSMTLLENTARHLLRKIGGEIRPAYATDA